MPRNDITHGKMRNSHTANVPDIFASQINLATLISVPGKYNSFAECPDEWS
jgi:hypothetical protein